MKIRCSKCLPSMSMQVLFSFSNDSQHLHVNTVESFSSSGVVGAWWYEKINFPIIEVLWLSTLPKWL